MHATCAYSIYMYIIFVMPWRSEMWKLSDCLLLVSQHVHNPLLNILNFCGIML